MRVKRGKTKKQRHKKVLAEAKGYRLTYSKLYRRAKEALLHAGQYAYSHRRKRQAQFRRIWIQRINAALQQGTELKYNQFISGLNKNKIVLNRKILADLALNHRAVFTEVVKTVK